MAGDCAPSVVALLRQPRLDRLVAVLPIAQAQERRGVEMLALALEIYTMGFVITLQAQSHGTVPFIDSAPGMALDVTDDRDGRYASQPAGASGEGEGSDWQWRLASRCTPTLDSQTRTLRLEIPALTWTRPDPIRQRFVSVRTVRGPWVFMVTLPTSSESGSGTAS